MNPTVHCLECGAEVRSGEVHGLCAKCLLQRGLASELAETIVIGEAGARSDVLVPPPMFPFDYGGYRVLRLLGRGGMGAVYEAEQRETGRRVALKVLAHSLDSADARKRFLREGRIAASVNHPNSVYIFGTEEIDGTPVIAMELVPGGTLQERVRDQGPLPPGQAVEAILQIIDGLEAAAALGVLHRDIKPSNCFIDTDGAIKVGDFGLSISTLARADSLLTVTGCVMGTPAYSSPEQLRGEALDLRSDIYSVGGTLYFLLTGRAPFEGGNMVALLATVLDKPAPSPRRVRPETPEALARVVLRCLAKPAGDRFKNYDELRRALLPFTSTAPTPATLGLRFVAAIIDFIAISLLVGSSVVVEVIATGSSPSPVRPWQEFAFLAFSVAYFSIPEGLWGASIGKALVGLRVAGLDRSAPGIPKALLRTLIYLLPALIAMPFCAALLSTARRRNGFAGLHDLLTKTRVIQKSACELRTRVTQEEEAVVSTNTGPQLGPYHVLATLATGGNEELLLGYDPSLRRRVWIRKGPETGVAAASAVARPARPGRLRWLQGSHSGHESWDAYEALSGAPLVDLVKAPQPWKSVRHWLLDLTVELAAAASDGSVPTTLSLERVWITTEGRAKLLDFPAPDGKPSAEPVPDTEPALFLNQVSISALEGRLATVEEARTRAAHARVPLVARSFLRQLRDAPDAATLSEPLRFLVHQPPLVSRGRRLGLVAAVFGLGLMFIPALSLVLLMPLLITGSLDSLDPYIMIDVVLIVPTGSSLACAVAFRHGPILRVLGIAVVTRDGRDASRPRMLWRTFVAWSAYLLAVAVPVLDARSAPLIVSITIPILLQVGLGIWSALLPDRGLQDRIAGTWLVPR